jgi:fatty acid desaturase
MENVSSSPVSAKMVESQSWKFYLVVLLWPLYLFFLPYMYQRFGAWSLAYMVFPGIYIFTWSGYLMHETWHKYVPNIPNDFLYQIYAIILFTDPQIYKILHGYHHALVNTYDDHEFHPLGRISNRFLRAIFNIFEIVFGIAFIAFVGQLTVPLNPKYKDKYRAWKTIITVLLFIVFAGGLGYLSKHVFGLHWHLVAYSFAISIWINSFIIHQSQLMEHGNLIVEGDYNKRNMATRNLNSKGFFEKIFLFFTHWDSAEHVLHHTKVAIYSRPFFGKVEMPQNAVMISFKDYFKILEELISGKENILK